MQAGTAKEKGDLLRSETSFNLWQSILRGSGAITGCRRCADVCPIGEDYAALLKDALDEIPEGTPAKQGRLDDMQRAEKAAAPPESYEASRRWIGERIYLYKKA